MSIEAENNNHAPHAALRAYTCYTPSSPLSPALSFSLFLSLAAFPLSASLNAFYLESQVQSRSPPSIPLMLDIESLLPLIPTPFQGNKSFIAFSNLGDADALTKTWKVRLFISRHTHHLHSISLGLHQGRQFSRAGTAPREPQLASMAPPKPDGRRRQCQVKTGVQKTEQVHE